MGRLIDADDFIEDIKTEIVNLALDGLKGTPRPREELYQIIDRINEQPTAYDVEKVVADVKEENKRALKEMYKIHGNQYTTILLKKHNDKIDEIVRNGGKE